jgi:predicted ATPase
MDRFVIISGCSGGGKSALLDALRMRGYAVVEEPGRRIVKRELESGGLALPWVDGIAFARKAMELSLADREAASQGSGWVFFDRGLIDAAAALQHLTGELVLDQLRWSHRSNKHVFLTPPWPEIYETDQERRHSFAEAVAEYERLREVYPSLGYEVTVLPKIDIQSRADFILAVLKFQGSPPQ